MTKLLSTSLLRGVQMARSACLAALSCAALTVSAQTSPAVPMGATAAPSADGRSAETWLRDGDRISIAFSPYTEHFRNNAEYAKHSYLVDLGIESKYDRVWGSDATLFGVAIFKNSYGQPSQYVYWGQQWDVKPWFFTKVTAGLLHGYKGKYKNNIPFNGLGTAPAIIPSVGFRYGNARVEAVVLGFSALMVTVGYTF